MEKKLLSKFEIRSEVLSLLQQLVDFGDDIPVSEQNKCLSQLKSIKNINDVLDFLIKEFPKSDYAKAKVISYFLMELGTLGDLKDPLWKCLKTNIPDEIKDLISITLRGLGDNADPEEYMSYLENPAEVVDRETQKLLETALINPEAQIDFLDFLFSLPENEQMNLVSSLKEDYSGENLANILIPALETRPSYAVEELIIETLGFSRTEIAVPALIDVEKYSIEEKFRKLARKNLNMLKLAGINIEESSNIQRGSELCNISTVYECYSSMIDGIGNQGIIFSRLKNNQDIIMFSVVINDIEGIVDCFGFYGISTDDFARIINRFQGESMPLQVTPEYCKTALLEAEIVNRSNNKPIPYEYTAWKTLLSDESGLDDSIENLAQEWAKPEHVKDGALVYQHPDFKHWFIEEADHPEAEKFINLLLDELTNNYELYSKDLELFMNYLTEQVSIVIPKLFDKNLREIYSKRLLNTSYLLNLQEMYRFRDITASVALDLKPGSGSDIVNSTFLRKLLKKTVIESFLRFQEAMNPAVKAHTITANMFTQPDKLEDNKLHKFNFADIIEELIDYWG